jgi:SHS2 domain-containing protein
MNRAGYEEIEHTADWALKVRGETLDDLFENAALGMLHLAGAEAAPGKGTPSTIDLLAPDAESLLIAWLEELLYRMDTSGVTFLRLKPKVRDARHLAAQVDAAPLAALGRSIKAVTYHNLAIEPTPEGFTATLVFDV